MVEFEQFEQVTATKCGQRKSRVSHSTSIFRYGYLVNYHALLFMYIFGDFHNCIREGAILWAAQWGRRKVFRIILMLASLGGRWLRNNSIPEFSHT